MASNGKSTQFLYGTKFGRVLLSITLAIKIPKLLGVLLRSPLSKFYINKFIKANNINMEPWAGKKFKSFNDFFTRKKDITFDAEKTHLISPSDSSLSVFDITEGSTFHVKGADYSLNDFLQCPELEEKFKGGQCLIFRLAATDYHRYCYIDNAHVDENHFIPGKLYSVQPLALEKYKVFTKNRRSWILLHTENFGTAAQIEVGAFSVGGIINHHSNCDVKKGDEKGYFDLHGSTIVVLFEKDKIKVKDEILEASKRGEEYTVKCGQWIGSAV